MTYEDPLTREQFRRRALMFALAVLLIAAALGTDAFAGGGKMVWGDKGDKAAMTWRSFIDDKAYLSSTVKGRQRRGGRGMFMKVEHSRLGCSGGGQDCFSIGVGGVSLGEGATFHPVNDARIRPNLSRRYGQLKTVSSPLDPEGQVMRANHKLCIDRSNWPDKCSKPRVATHTY